MKRRVKLFVFVNLCSDGIKRKNPTSTQLCTFFKTGVFCCFFVDLTFYCDLGWSTVATTLLVWEWMGPTAPVTFR